MVSALVTGGAGFIGSHLVQALLEQGLTVRVLDDFSTGRKENLPKSHNKLEVLQGDLRDLKMVREATHGVEVIFHHAAFVSPPKSMKDPQTCFDVNVNGTFILLEEARLARVRRVVLASSAAIYGDAKVYPLTEETPLCPLSPYAASKCINEVYAGMYTRAYGLEVTALRYFNVYGPRQPLDSEYAAAIPTFITNCIAAQPVTLYGDGKQTRDLIYVADVIRANLIAAENPNAPGHVFNICTGQETSILDLLAVLRKLFPGSPEILRDRPRPGDIYRSVGSPERASQILGFHAQTTITEGLQATVAWMRN